MVQTCVNTSIIFCKNPHNPKFATLSGQRRETKKPKSNLRPGGNFYNVTEFIENFSSPKTREAQLMAQLSKDVEAEEERARKERDKTESENQREGDMKVLVQKLENLKSPIPDIPEYKDAYKVDPSSSIFLKNTDVTFQDFPRERPVIARPGGEIGLADGSKIPPSPRHARFAKKIDQDLEYKSIYLDPDRDRTIYRKAPLALRGSDHGSQVAMTSSHRYFYDPSTEVRTHYGPRVRVEGEGVDEDTRSRRLGRPRANFWASGDVGEQFGRVNAAGEQNAFQVLQTRVHEESVVGKPPIAGRRFVLGLWVILSCDPDG